MMNIRVIIPAFNEQNALGNVLDEIPADLVKEIVVVDNASTDVSVQMVREQFPQVELIENKTNLGFAGAITRGKISYKLFSLKCLKDMRLVVLY